MTTSDGLTPLWICPKCGARLASRNLWHSCGASSLEALFANADPEVVESGRRYVAVLQTLGDVQVIVQKTRLVCVARVRFAGAYPRKHSLLAYFALHRWLASQRIVKTEDYGSRWCMHYIRVASGADVDDELRSWLQEAHDSVGVQSHLRRGAS